ncbi:hypothetical protein [Corynebacterium auriscanis]|uniref:hypothetical protein n=1 Tax=Corynebacterium auriscanis TaxID=99807 RepID=UPI003CE91987
MFQTKNAKLRNLWFILSVILSAVALFGAMYWAPMHNNGAGLLWAIFTLMAVQSYFLHKEGDRSVKEG